MAQQRICWIDWLKTFAIMLVVLGHCVQWSDADYEHNVLFRFIYAFHMPLFMAVSGYLSYKAVMPIDVIKKRFIQLMLPFYLWPFVLWIFGVVDNIGSKYLDILIKPDNGGLWFLYALFFISLIEFIRKKVVQMLTDNFKKTSVDVIEYTSIIILAGLLNLILLKTNFKLYGYNFISWYYIFYSLGSVMRKNNDWLMKHIRPIGIVALICYIMGAAFWNIQEPPTLYQWINLGSVFVYVYKLIVAVAGILAAFYVFSQFVNREPAKFVGYVAGLTLGIYAVHQPIVRYVIGWLPTMNLWLLIPLVFICTVAITMQLSEYYRPTNGHLSYCWESKRNKNNFIA